MNYHNLMRWLLVFAVGFLSLLLFGCMHRPVSYTPGGNPYVVEIWASDECPNYSETVTLRATVTNVDSRVHTVELANQAVLDIVVGPQAEEHRWSDGKPSTSDLTNLELKPGESKNIEMPWLVQPGYSKFMVSAQFIDAPQLASNPIRASISVGSSCSVIGP